MNFFITQKPGVGSQWYPRIPGRSNSNKRQLRCRQAKTLHHSDVRSPPLTYSPHTEHAAPEPILHPNEVLIQAFTNKRTTVGDASDTGVVYVTSERLIFIPHPGRSSRRSIDRDVSSSPRRPTENRSVCIPSSPPASYSPQECSRYKKSTRTSSSTDIPVATIKPTRRHGEVDIIIADLISMNVIETSPTRHHFLFAANPENDENELNTTRMKDRPRQHRTLHINGSVRFSSAIKAHSFLGLIFSLWVEQQVCEALDETLDRSTLSASTDWSDDSSDGPTDILPTYAESQAALQRYLTRRQSEVAAATANV